MTAVHTPSRRALLNALLALPVLGTAASAAAKGPDTGKYRRTAVTDSLTGIFSNRRSAAVLGQAYLLQRPEEADPQTLETLLLSPSNLGVLTTGGQRLSGFAHGRVDAHEAKQAFQDLRRYDFDQGFVVHIDGCMFSITELRLCALIALV
jgi:hypothetical protein